MARRANDSPLKRPPLLTGLGLALLILVVHFASFDIVETPLVTDVRYFVYFAWQVAEGAVPHVDFFDNKTQLAALLGGALMALGSAFGKPLLTLRLGYLGLAAGAGLLIFAIHRRLARGSTVAGLVAVLSYCAFPLLGFLPSIGNIPKLVAATCASIMGLCVYRDRWFWAGFAGAVGFMDWQIGALAGVGAVVAALASPERRLAKAGAALGGGLAGLSLFLAYYAYQDALGPAFQQTIEASFFRGTTSLAHSNLASRLARMFERLSASAPHSYPFLYIGMLGIGVAAIRGWRQRNSAEGRMLLALLVYHLGVVTFSLLDFQGYGDLFILLHSGAFFLAITLNAGRELALGVLDRRAASPPGRLMLAEALLLIAVFALARPGPLRPKAPIPIGRLAPDLRFQDQAEVAAQIEAELGGRRLLFLRYAELPFLMRYRNPLPYVYWNNASYSYTREAEGEDIAQTARRMLREVAPDAYAINPNYLPEPLPGFAERSFHSANGRYEVTLLVRE